MKEEGGEGKIRSSVPPFPHSLRPFARKITFQLRILPFDSSCKRGAQMLELRVSRIRRNYRLERSYNSLYEYRNLGYFNPILFDLVLRILSSREFSFISLYENNNNSIIYHDSIYYYSKRVSFAGRSLCFLWVSTNYRIFLNDRRRTEAPFLLWKFLTLRRREYHVHFRWQITGGRCSSPEENTTRGSS